MSSIVTDNGKFDAEFCRCIEVANDAFQRLIQRDRKVRIKIKGVELLLLTYMAMNVVALQKDAKNNMDGIYKQQGSFRENGNKHDIYSHKVTVEITGMHNEERWFGEFNTHRTVKPGGVEGNML